MNVNTLGNLQQNIVSTDLIKRLEQMAWLWNNMEPINDQFPCVYEAITALREIEGLKEKLKTALIWDDIESERNEKLQARIVELEKCMETPRIEDLEKIEQYEKLLLKRTHMCSGRDCVGIYQETTGSLPRCDDCTELKRIMGEGNVV